MDILLTSSPKRQRVDPVLSKLNYVQDLVDISNVLERILGEECKFESRCDCLNLLEPLIALVIRQGKLESNAVSILHKIVPRENNAFPIESYQLLAELKEGLGSSTLWEVLDEPLEEHRDQLLTLAKACSYIEFDTTIYQLCMLSSPTARESFFKVRVPLDYLDRMTLNPHRNNAYWRFLCADDNMAFLYLAIGLDWTDQPLQIYWKLVMHETGPFDAQQARSHLFGDDGHERSADKARPRLAQLMEQCNQQFQHCRLFQCTPLQIDASPDFWQDWFQRGMALDKATKLWAFLDQYS